MWPLYYKNQVTVGNNKNPLAICSLWTPREMLKDLIKELPVAIIGNLYSADGISYLIRNILANPNIRALAVCGRDLNNSGEMLLKFFANGIDDDHYIIGSPSVRIHPEIDRDDLDKLRRSLNVYDYRGIIRPEQLYVKLHPDITILRSYLPVFDGPCVYPDHQPNIEEYPSEVAGITLHVSTIAQGFNALLRQVMLFGKTTGTAYGSRQKELLHTTVVIEDEDNSWNPSLPIGKDTIERHKELLQKSNGHGDDVMYTYGHRMHDYFMFDQVEEAMQRIRDHNETRRAVISLWDPNIDSYSNSPPCMTLVQFQLRDNRLHCTVYYRSHDVWRAWIPNVYGMRSVQEEVAAEVGAELGALIIVGNSSHIYEENWESAQAYCNKMSTRNPRLLRDPRGSFNINVEDDMIRIDHYDTDGAIVDTIESDNFATLQQKLVSFSSIPEHIFYLGTELQKAWIAKKFGIEYKQDRELNFGSFYDSTEE